MTVRRHRGWLPSVDPGTTRGPARLSLIPGGQHDPDGAYTYYGHNRYEWVMPAQCWCGARIVEVDSTTVRQGLT
jgi:hypothetical protein